MAEIGTPAGSSHSGAITGHWAAGAVKRALGCDAGVPVSGVQSWRFQSMRWAGFSLVMPSHHTSPSSVRPVLVNSEFFSRVSMACRLVSFGRARGHAEEAGLGVDGPQVALVVVLHPADVVADGLDLPALEGRDEHGQVGLAAGRREGGGHVLDVVLGRGELEDEHVLGQPALVAGHHRGDAQGEALLAQQGVAAVAGAVGPDRALLGEVDDVLVLGVARPGHVVLALFEGRADRVQAGDEVAVAQHVEDLLAHAGHDPHVDGHVRRVGELARRCGRWASRGGPC